jgi:hypothetical protein
MAEQHDPGVSPEDEGIPDLTDGSPEAERAGDPQRMPVPGDEPVAADAYGTTTAEQIEGEPLDRRLAAEEPDVGEEEPLGEPNAIEERDPDREPEPDDDPLADGGGLPDEETGQLADDPYPGRPRNQDVFSHGNPVEGLSAEEAAVHVPEDQDRTGGR